MPEIPDIPDISEVVSGAFEKVNKHLDASGFHFRAGASDERTSPEDDEA